MNNTDEFVRARTPLLGRIGLVLALLGYVATAFLVNDLIGRKTELEEKLRVLEGKIENLEKKKGQLSAAVEKKEEKLQNPVACEPGMRFAIREGGKTVGAGVVTEVT